ncbi:hypothetical protein V8G54_010122 [Vigna mungo]|uniref:Uncharacterized protein n=1 Tax=Vigna mungo TaxID=3915 RepID=A0AAQ3NXG0_VIGMU
MNHKLSHRTIPCNHIVSTLHLPCHVLSIQNFTSYFREVPNHIPPNLASFQNLFFINKHPLDTSKGIFINSEHRTRPYTPILNISLVLVNPTLQLIPQNRFTQKLGL